MPTILVTGPTVTKNYQNQTALVEILTASNGTWGLVLSRTTNDSDGRERDLGK